MVGQSDIDKFVERLPKGKEAAAHVSYRCLDKNKIADGVLMATSG
jgi:hypothetical protein